jgi:hypothetical protein
VTGQHEQDDANFHFVAQPYLKIWQYTLLGVSSRHAEQADDVDTAEGNVLIIISLGIIGSN